jgi:hypothetical protein
LTRSISDIVVIDIEGLPHNWRDRDNVTDIPEISETVTVTDHTCCGYTITREEAERALALEGGPFPQHEPYRQGDGPLHSRRNMTPAHASLLSRGDPDDPWRGGYIEDPDPFV